MSPKKKTVFSHTQIISSLDSLVPCVGLGVPPEDRKLERAWCEVKFLDGTQY